MRRREEASLRLLQLPFYGATAAVSLWAVGADTQTGINKVLPDLLCGSAPMTILGIAAEHVSIWKDSTFLPLLKLDVWKTRKPSHRCPRMLSSFLKGVNGEGSAPQRRRSHDLDRKVLLRSHVSIHS